MPVQVSESSISLRSESLSYKYTHRGGEMQGTSSSSSYMWSYSLGFYDRKEKSKKEGEKKKMEGQPHQLVTVFKVVGFSADLNEGHAQKEDGQHPRCL
jgi:hypothetical protein